MGGSNRWTDAILVLASGLVAFALVGWWTPSGPGTTLDSFSYFSVARQLAAGHGLTSAFAPFSSDLSFGTQLEQYGRIPLAHWQPGYPALLGLLDWAGLNVVQAARLLAASGAAVLVGSAVLVARRTVRSGVLATGAFAALVLIRPNREVWDVAGLGGSGIALAESIFVPLFFALFVAGVVAAGKRGAGVTAALILGVVLACTVRPEGVVLGLAFAVAAGASEPRPWRRMAGCVLAGPLTLVGWPLVVSWWSGPVEAVRIPRWHPSGTAPGEAVRSLAGWFAGVQELPLGVAGVLVLLGVVAPVVVTLVPVLHRRILGDASGLGVMAVACAVTIPAYLLLLAVTGMFLDRGVEPDPRHLLPIQPIGYLLWLILVTGAARARGPVRAGRSWAAVGIAAWALVMVPALWQIPSQQRLMRDYARQDFPLTFEVDRSVVLVTNAPETIWSVTGRPVLLLPKPSSSTSGRRNPDFEEELAEVARLARERPLLVALGRMFPGEDQSGRPAVKLLAEQHGFTEIGSCGTDLRIWAPPGSDIPIRLGQGCTTR